MGALKIVHLCTALNRGGAEKILYQTIVGLSNDFEHEVLLLSYSGPYVELLLNNGVRVFRFNLTSICRYFFSSRKRIIFHSYLKHTHVLSSIFKFLGFKVVWSFHGASPFADSLIDKMVNFLIKIIPNRVSYVSRHCKFVNVKNGASPNKSCPVDIIYNCVDVSHSSHDLRPDVQINIGILARFHPVKNFELFFSIARNLLYSNKNYNFIVAGPGCTSQNDEIVTLIDRFGLRDSVELLGDLNDTTVFFDKLDLLISTSKSEAFGLSILEGLASNINVVSFNLPVIDELLPGYNVNLNTNSVDEMVAFCNDKINSPIDSSLSYFILSTYSVKNMILNYKSFYMKVFYA